MALNACETMYKHLVFRRLEIYLTLNVNFDWIINKQTKSTLLHFLYCFLNLNSQIDFFKKKKEENDVE